MKIVYIAHPISGDIDANLADIARIIRIININAEENPLFIEVVPCAPYYADCIALDDNKEYERRKGIFNGQTLILSGVFDELWLTGDKISLGMQEEVKLFMAMGRTIVDYTNKI